MHRRLEMARADEQASRYASAEALYSTLVSQLANAPGHTTLEAMLGIGRVRLHQGDSVRALLAFRDAAWHSPDSADAHAWISHLLKDDPCGTPNDESTSTSSGGATACRGDLKPKQSYRSILFLFMIGMFLVKMPVLGRTCLRTL